MKNWKSGLMAFALFAAIGARAAGPEPIKKLHDALSLAKKGEKMSFVLLGRPTCGNCNALREYIAREAVPLPESQYVYADLNIDDASDAKSFEDRFRVEGTTLPFVVVADSRGKMLASRTGGGNPEAYKELLAEANEKLAKKDAKKPQGRLQPLPAAKPSIVIASATPEPARELRVWTSTSGQTVKAAFVKESDGYVVLKREGGALVKIKLADISAEDRQYIAKEQSVQ